MMSVINVALQGLALFHVFCFITLSLVIATGNCPECALDYVLQHASFCSGQCSVLIEDNIYEHETSCLAVRVVKAQPVLSLHFYASTVTFC